MAQVGAEQVELPLIEFESREAGHVGRMNEDHRPPPLRHQIAERVTVEQGFIQEFGKHVSPAEKGRPEPEPVGRRPENPRTQLALPVLPEKAVFEVVENPVAVEGIVGRREAAARKRIDDVQLIDQPLVDSVPPDRRPRQFPQHAVGERRGPRAAAGEGRDDEETIGAAGCGRGQVGGAVAVVRVELLQRRIHRRPHILAAERQAR